jgi:hypothetical protein
MSTSGVGSLSRFTHPWPSQTSQTTLDSHTTRPRHLTDDRGQGGSLSRHVRATDPGSWPGRVRQVEVDKACVEATERSHSGGLSCLSVDLLVDDLGLHRPTYPATAPRRYHQLIHMIGHP